MLESISDISQISAKSSRASPSWLVLSLDKKNCIFSLLPHYHYYCVRADNAWTALAQQYCDC